MNLFNPPAAGFDHPLEILDGCHQRVLRFSELAVRIARQVAASGVDAEARDAARSVIRYFDDAGAKHHRDEEEDLFPALGRLAEGPDKATVHALVERLLADHRALEALWRQVRGQLLAVIEGDAGMDAALADQLLRAYERHIDVEERELLPLANRLLDPGSVASLGRSMAARRGVAPPRG